MNFQLISMPVWADFAGWEVPQPPDWLWAEKDVQREAKVKGENVMNTAGLRAYVSEDHRMR